MLRIVKESSQGGSNRHPVDTAIEDVLPAGRRYPPQQDECIINKFGDGKGVARRNSTLRRGELNDFMGEHPEGESEHHGFGYTSPNTAIPDSGLDSTHHDANHAVARHSARALVEP
jgi:hypothetical protein